MARRSLRQADITTKSSPDVKSLLARTSDISMQKTPSKKADISAPKSKYFAHADPDEGDATDDDGPEMTESDFDEAAADETSEHTSEEAENDESFDEEPPKKKRRAVPPKKSTPKSTPKAVRSHVKGSELWREGMETGLEPGTQIIIKKPKARPAGKTPYRDDTVHPNTLLFLADLKANNDREWLKMHDPDFRASQSDFYSFIETVTQRLVEIDETIPELPIKDIVFRIYRDIRFSPDPTPYKPYFSAAWSRTGRKGPYAAYYLQISRGDSFIGGGLWHPEAAPIAALRNNIDRRPQQIKQVLTEKGLRQEFLQVQSSNAEKAVKAFVSRPMNADSALKTKPKGYNADHKDIDLLRLKNFTIGRKLTDEEVLGPKFLDRVSTLLSCMLPFITYLNSIVMPDDAAASDTESSGSSEGEDDAD